MESDHLFELEIITPDRAFYKGPVRMVELNTAEGRIGIYKNHIPLAAIVKPGIVTITEDVGKREAKVSEGFMEVLKHKVTILTEKAMYMEGDHPTEEEKQIPTV